MQRPPPLNDPATADPGEVLPAPAPGARGGRIPAGLWAVADQALFAGANFLLNVLLAGWIDKPAYGAFAVGLAVLFLLGSMHVALLGEPLLVLGAGRFAQRRGQYIAAVYLGHWLVGAAVLLVMCAAGGALMLTGSRDAGIALIGLGIASPFVLLLWLARRTCYLTNTPHQAAIAGAIYLALMTALLLALRRLDMLDLPMAILVMGVSSALVGGALAWRTRPAGPPIDAALMREVTSAHLGYGRWSALTNMVIFLSSQALIIVVAMLVSLEASGTLRAILNLITPMHLVIAANVLLLVPILARSSPQQSRPVLMRATLMLLAFAGAYALLLGIAQRPLLQMLYGEKYLPPAHLLWILGATLLTSALADVAASVLRARQRPDLLLGPYIAAAAVGLVGGAVLTAWLGLSGAVLAMAASSATAAGGLWLFARRLEETPRPPERGRRW